MIKALVTALVLLGLAATPVVWGQDAGTEDSGPLFLPMVYGSREAAEPDDTTGSPTPTPTITPTSSATPTPEVDLHATATATPTATPTMTATPTCLNLDTAPMRSSKFGVQMYWDTRPETPFFGSFVESRAGWVRVEALWQMVEPQNTTPAHFLWTHMDGELAVASHVETRVIGTVGYNPTWAAGNPNGVIDRTALSELTEFVAALVERYDGDGVDDALCSPRVDYWEFYNEPDRNAEHNTGYFRNAWGDHPAQYAAMLQAVYPVVKAANPRAKVLFGGIAYEWFTDSGGQFVRSFTDDVLANGAAPFFDYMNFHLYPEFWQVHAAYPPGLLEKAAEIRAILARHGVEKPLIVTETGSHSNSAVSFRMTEERQARYVPQLLAQALAADVKAAIWFMLYDTPAANNYPYKLGLVTSDSPPRAKLSFGVYQTAVGHFETATFVRSLTLEERGRPDLHAYLFDDQTNRHKLYLVWLTPVETEASAAMRIPAEFATVRDMYGIGVVIVDEADGLDDGFVTVTAGGAPVYIEVAD